MDNGRAMSERQKNEPRLSPRQTRGLFAIRGKPAFLNGASTTVLQAEKREHSRKPEEFYALVEEPVPQQGGIICERAARWLVLVRRSSRFVLKLAEAWLLNLEVLPASFFAWATCPIPKGNEFTTTLGATPCAGDRL